MTKISLLFCLFFINSLPAARGQVAAPEGGANPYKSYSGGSFDHIEMENGNLFLQIPIVNLPQKGQLALSYSLIANGSKWASTMSCDSTGDCWYAYAANDVDSDYYFGASGQASVQLVRDQELSLAAKQHESIQFFDNQSGCSALNCVDLNIEEWENSPYFDLDFSDITLLGWTPLPTAYDYEQDDLWTEVRLYDATGAFHVLGNDSANYRFLHANDGSGYTVDLGSARTIETATAGPASPYSIYDAHGIKHTWTAPTSATPFTQYVMSDTNGNQITGGAAGLVDSLGRTIVTSTSPTFDCPAIAGQPTADAETLWQVKDASGNILETYKLCGTTIHLRTDFYGLPGNVTEQQSCNTVTLPTGDTQYECTTWDETDVDVSVFQSLVLPNGTYWGFKYSQPASTGAVSYGDLIGIVLPSGGELDYTYATLQTCGLYQGDSGPPLARMVSSRMAEPLVGQSVTTTYTYESLDTIETTAGNDTVHTFVRDHIYPVCGAAETDTKWYQGSRTSGALLQEQTVAYQSAGSPQAAKDDGFRPIINRLPTTKTTVREGSPVSSEALAYDSLFTDVQPHAIFNSGGIAYSLMPTQAQVYLSHPTSVSDGIQTRATNRLAKNNAAYASANLLYLPGDTSILDDNQQLMAQTIYGYDEAGSPQGVHGNNTSTRSVSLTSGVPDSVVTTVYNSAGKPISTTDARGNAGEAGNHTTTLTYDSTGIFVARVDRPTTNGQAHTSYFGTDPTLGVLLWQSDENASGPNDPAHTTTYTYDLIGRAVKAVSPPGGGSTQVCFSDETIAGCGTAGSPPYTVQVSVQTGTSAGPQTTSTKYDGLGRVLNTTVAPGTSIASLVDTTYDSEGHVYSVSNPHGSTSAPTDGFTTFIYDALGRRHLQTNPDTTTLQWSYSGNTVISIDEALNSWQRTSDLAGRLVQVVEPGGLNTTYSYDALNNLKCVDQWGTTAVGSACSSSKMRTFQYDSFSRLLWAQNPETGVVCYGQGSGTAAGCQANGYDPNGNLLYKTDARGVAIHYTYDALNRITSQIATDNSVNDAYYYESAPSYYSGIPFFCTNGVGRLCLADHGGYSGTAFNYDTMGRIASTLYGTTTNWHGYDHGMTVVYDLAGNPISLTYPDNRIVDQIFDGAGRLAKVSNRAAGGTPNYDFIYGSDTLPNPGDTTTGGIQYTAAGAPQSFVLGNGVGQFNGYNSRLQPCHTMASMPVFGGTVSALLTGTGPGNLLDRESFYNSSATNLCGPQAGNNGNIWSIADGLPAGNSQSFSYDALNRLSTAARSDGAYNHTYNYDSFGNMLLHDNLASPSSVAWSIDQATNRLLRSHNGGVTWGDNSYDLAGNLTSVSDGINPTVTYQYSALSQVSSINSGSTASYGYNGSDERAYKIAGGGWTNYIYLNGQPMAELGSDGNWTDYIYANGQKIAKVGPDTRFHLSGTVAQSGGEHGLALIPPPNLLVQPNDRISWRQFNHNAVGGINVAFDNGQSTGWHLPAADGQFTNQDSTEDQWLYRTANINAYAGSKIYSIQLLKDVNTPVGNWFMDIADITIIHADGSILQIPMTPGNPLVCESDPPLDPTYCNSIMTYTAATDPTGPAGMASATHYYLDDHLGTTQMELSGGGWPIWQGQFTPFGQEIVNGAPLPQGQPDGSSMHYKFTGKERDTESGLDYFGARYYASSMGRFMSADDGSDWNPGNPQSLNLYSYTHNNPLSLVDPDGHTPIPAQSAHIANAIAQDRTLHAVFNAANNFSPRGFENAFNSGALNSLSSAQGNTLRGLAGEAKVIDDINGSRLENFFGPTRDRAVVGSAGPSLPGVVPDVFVQYQNVGLANGPATQLLNVVTGAGVADVNIPGSVTMNFLEVKSGINASSIGTGVDQAIATAGAINSAGLGGRAISTLVVDAGAWGSLSSARQASYVSRTAAAGAYIQIQPGLADEARQRAQNMVDRAH